MDIQFLYAGGKKKALTFSYDDGQIYDRKLIDIFNHYGMRGTFHLNSDQLGKEGFVTQEEVATLYSGHEVACHGKKHCYLTQLTKEGLVNEVWEDRKALEALTGGLVTGMSYAFGEYFDQVVETLRCLGIHYSRTVCSTQGFGIPAEFLTWHPTCHHNEQILEKGETFLNPPDYMKMPLFYVWGHSFEFHREQNWELIESFCEKMSQHDDIWYATNGEIEAYVSAMRSLQFSASGQMVYNPSSLSIWFEKDGKCIELKSGETLALV